MIQAAENYDVPALLEIFGPDGKEFLSSADAVQDKKYAIAFAAKARTKNVVTANPKNKARATLMVGDDDWPFPVPFVQQKGKWHFDDKEGHKEILYRRIGANELDAIQVCRGFVEAQAEYAITVHDSSGINQYAQKIFSTPGKHRWPVLAKRGWNPRRPYQRTGGPRNCRGLLRPRTLWISRLLFQGFEGTGACGSTGTTRLCDRRIMIGGFALVAVPAEYRVTGVRTFIVSYDGIVYQKDFGPDSLKIVKDMERYNPDATWQRTDDQWPPEVAHTSTTAAVE